MNEAVITSIRERYQYILAQIAETAARCGRAPKDVHLVVVSKFQPLEVIQAALVAGITSFGENYAEEAVEKIFAINNPAVEWHMIGHIQSRKAELVAANFTMVHSLDSVKLAGRLDRFCGEQKRALPVLLEFNVSGEEGKFGFPAWEEERWTGLQSEIEEILTFSHLQVCGLMTMPPFYRDPRRTRPYFQRLRQLQEYLIKQFPGTEWKELSMGTSVDFVAAIQEGATLIRIGQAILGSRNH
jgi:PLP dependent protein